MFRDAEKIIFASAGYFELVGYQWLAGTAGAALQEPYAVVLTASNAGLYFPGKKPEEILGKDIYFDDSVRMTVTGIVKDIAQHTV